MAKIGLFDRIVESDDGLAVLKESRIPVSDILKSFQQGEAIETFVDRTGISGLDLMAGLAFVALGSDAAPGLPLVASSPPYPDLSVAFRDDSLSQLFPHWGRPARRALAAGMLQAFDFWEESHEAAQEAEDLGEARVSAYWHGIAHRREPDAGNASYWFRRVGRHPVFADLATIVRPWADAAGPSAAKLVQGGEWNPFGFIQLATQASADQDLLARRIQRAEIALLLEATLQGGG